MGYPVTVCPLLLNLVVLDHLFVDQALVLGHMLGDFDVGWLRLGRWY